MRSTKVLLMDAYCASHVGNDVLLESSMKFAKKIFENPEFIIHAKNSSAFEATHYGLCGRRIFPDAPKGVPQKALWFIGELLFMVIHTMNFLTFKVAPHKLAFGVRRRSIKDYENCDVALSIGGEMLNDSFRKTLPMYLFMYWFSKKCGNTTIIFPQSVGPLKRGWTRTLTRAVLRKIDIICPRDEPSRLELESLGFSSALNLPCPDVGVDQPMSSALEAEKFLSSVGITLNKNSEWIGLTVSGWIEEGVGAHNYLHDIVAGLKRVASNRQIAVLLMPANMPVNGNGRQDYDVSEDLHIKISDICTCYILPPQAVSACMFKGIASLMHCFVSTRMHAAIMSTMAPTPTLTVNTQRKLGGYMDRIGQAQYSLDIGGLSSDVIANKIVTLLEDREQVLTHLVSAERDQRDKLAAAGKLIKRHLSEISR